MIPKGGLGALMKQAQQMQDNMKRAQIGRASCRERVSVLV